MGDSPLQTSNSQEELEDPVYSILIPEVDYLNELLEITQDNSIPIAPLLPRGRNRKFPITEVDHRIEVQMLEDLLDFALHEINGPLGLINPSQTNSKNEQSDEYLNTNWPER